MSRAHIPLAEKACAFLTASTDPFHAVASAVAKLEAAGFSRVWAKHGGAVANLQPGGKYYYTVHHSTLVAFTVGAQFQANQGGFKIIGGHTDSPNLRVKPRSSKPAKHNCLQLGVETYGGGLWHTWFDRDLSISGKVLVRKENGKIAHQLVQITEPVARVSTLCIHLQTPDEKKAFDVNTEEHTSPIIATAADMAPNAELEQAAEAQLNGDGWHKGQEPLLLQKIAEKLNVSVDKIADWDLSLYDTQGASIGGMNQEFLYSARLDNLATVFCATEALAAHNVGSDTDICMIVCFDHEEVGSGSSHGAGSPVLAEAMRKVATAVGCTDVSGMIARSFCLSIDQAHAIHPNYASKHQAQHAPTLNSGIVIKTNSNQRYTTNSFTGFVVREIGRKTGVPVQEFMVRNDCPCGSTIGPTIAARTGLRTVDAGMPQLSMHSCREVMGTMDLMHGLRLFQGFFEHFRAIDDAVEE